MSFVGCTRAHTHMRQYEQLDGNERPLGFVGGERESAETHVFWVPLDGAVASEPADASAPCTSRRSDAAASSKPGRSQTTAALESSSTEPGRSESGRASARETERRDLPFRFQVPDDRVARVA